ncbi:NADH dehydrogenase [Microbotryum lychnidis-dioicae p1A1 Lamole]|uniref:NADH dehydrogenase n=1 Tax=Microbotryum lychnidis-dioicae (strain p1A1 Lamole / MvSl-1064) TaxID=683840 RepID=U5H6K2_USTV1|nr:NADH dehydrogenase [Microbotryum lychnidis-dioicae p1A1 Lamole]|eukprot:KDE06866.1 NADH dehydrogenase [Microbotryum lychnidis-dioicae p1A1 Lamole]
MFRYGFKPSTTIGTTAVAPKFKVAAPGLAGSRRSFSHSSRWAKQRVVILGSGWGGYELMRKVDKRSYDVVMVSPNTYFAMTPLLASTAVGTIEFRCALEPVRRYPQVVSFQAQATSIDLKNKSINCLPTVGGSASKLKNGSESPGTEVGSSRDFEHSALYPGVKPFALDYDILTISVGCYSQTFNTPGVKEFGHFLKDVKDARRIRSRILECFELAASPTVTDVERANLLHFVVVGGGPTGIEFAAELHDLIEEDMKRHYPHVSKFCRITIYDVSSTILGAFDKSLVEYAMTQFQRQGVQIKTERHVVKVNKANIEIKEDGTVPFGMLVWSTGLAPNPLIASLKELEHDEKTHSLRVNGHFNPKTVDGKELKDVYVIGDAAMLDQKLPATAQVANQEAVHLAKILNARVRDLPLPGPFEFHNQGIMTYIGNWKALFDRSGATQDGFREGGRFAWLLWRSAYWVKAMSWRNRCTLAFYWFANWIFGRSITRF